MTPSPLTSALLIGFGSNGPAADLELAVPNTGPHDHREVDPYEAASFEHLGHLTTVESLNVIATKANADWIAPIANLTNRYPAETQTRIKALLPGTDVKFQ